MQEVAFDAEYVPDVHNEQVLDVLVEKLPAKQEAHVDAIASEK